MKKILLFTLVTLFCLAGLFLPIKNTLACNLDVYGSCNSDNNGYTCCCGQGTCSGGFAQTCCGMCVLGASGCDRCTTTSVNIAGSASISNSGTCYKAGSTTTRVTITGSTVSQVCSNEISSVNVPIKVQSNTGMGWVDCVDPYNFFGLLFGDGGVGTGTCQLPSNALLGGSVQIALFPNFSATWVTKTGTCVGHQTYGGQITASGSVKVWDDITGACNANPTSGTSPLAVAFSVSPSGGTGAGNYKYTWSNCTSTTGSCNKSFTTGTYNNIKVKVEDKNGCAPALDLTCPTITVSDAITPGKCDGAWGTTFASTDTSYATAHTCSSGSPPPCNQCEVGTSNNLNFPPADGVTKIHWDCCNSGVCSGKDCWAMRAAPAVGEDGKCGSAARTWAVGEVWDEGTMPIVSLCEKGTFTNYSPPGALPLTPGGVQRTWDCEGKNDGTTVRDCTATRATAAVPGTCGPASIPPHAIYPSTATDFDGAMCGNGNGLVTYTSGSGFPAPGGTTTWTCGGSGGGGSSGTCTATCSALGKGTCGGADEHFYEDSDIGYSPYSQCGTGNVKVISIGGFPDPGDYRQWRCCIDTGNIATCNDSSGDGDTACEAYHNLNGVCGSAATPPSGTHALYASSGTFTFPAANVCVKGTNPGTQTLTDGTSSISWACGKKYHGTDASCEAKREAPPAGPSVVCTADRTTAQVNGLYYINYTATASEGTSPYTYTWTDDWTGATNPHPNELKSICLSVGPKTTSVTVTDHVGATATTNCPTVDCTDGPVTGQCGTAPSYTGNPPGSSYPPGYWPCDGNSRTFYLGEVCAAGNYPATPPTLPAACEYASTISWVCGGQNGGNPSGPCTVYREVPGNCGPAGYLYPPNPAKIYAVNDPWPNVNVATNWCESGPLGGDVSDPGPGKRREWSCGSHYCRAYREWGEGKCPEEKKSYPICTFDEPNNVSFCSSGGPSPECESGDPNPRRLEGTGPWQWQCIGSTTVNCSSAFNGTCGMAGATSGQFINPNTGLYKYGQKNTKIYEPTDHDFYGYPCVNGISDPVSPTFPTINNPITTWKCKGSSANTPLSGDPAGADSPTCTAKLKIPGVCGIAATNAVLPVIAHSLYSYTGSTTPIPEPPAVRETLCVRGTLPTGDIILGKEVNSEIPWTCAGINYKSGDHSGDAACKAKRVPFVNGACGPAGAISPAIKTYNANDTAFDGALCNNYINPTPLNPTFPSATSTPTPYQTSWQCNGLGLQGPGWPATNAICNANIKVNGECGTSDSHKVGGHGLYLYTGSDTSLPVSGEKLCSSPTQPTGIKLLKDYGSEVPWVCDGLNTGDPTNCKAIRVDGECGPAGNTVATPNIKTYDAGSVAFSGAFCTEGNPTPASPIFPSASSSPIPYQTSWTCSVEGEGPTCTAKLKAKATCGTSATPPTPGSTRVLYPYTGTPGGTDLPITVPPNAPETLCANPAISTVTTPNLPTAGNSSVPWKCKGINYPVGDPGGDTDCSATRDFPTLSVTCTVAPSPTQTGVEVVRTAVPTGGTNSYIFSWIGDDGLTAGNTAIVKKTYLTPGPAPSFFVKAATVTVKSGTQTVTKDCPATVYPALSATCSVSPNSGTTPLTVTWSAVPSGGSGTYSQYDWAGNDGPTGTTYEPVRSATRTYTVITPSPKTATVKVTDSAGNKSNAIPCSKSVSISAGECGTSGDSELIPNSRTYGSTEPFSNSDSNLCLTGRFDGGTRPTLPLNTARTIQWTCSGGPFCTAIRLGTPTGTCGVASNGTAGRTYYYGDTFPPNSPADFCATGAVDGSTTPSFTAEHIKQTIQWTCTGSNPCTATLILGTCGPAGNMIPPSLEAKQYGIDDPFPNSPTDLCAIGKVDGGTTPDLQPKEFVQGIKWACSGGPLCYAERIATSSICGATGPDGEGKCNGTNCISPSYCVLVPTGDIHNGTCCCGSTQIKGAP